MCTTYPRERKRNTSHLSDILLLVVKAKLIGSDDVRRAADVLEGVRGYGLPACNEFGFNNKRACGFVTCPNCEVARRVRFGDHIGRVFSLCERATLVHHRVTCDDLHGLSTNAAFTDPSMLKFFARLKGLVAVKVTAGFDRSCRAWVLDRVAVTTAPLPQVSKPTLARGITVHDSSEYASSEQDSLVQHIGALAGFVEAVMNIGANPLDIVAAECTDGLDHVADSVLDAQARWKSQGTRHHLLRLVNAKGTCDQTSQLE